jgi:hypothetical protein
MSRTGRDVRVQRPVQVAKGEVVFAILSRCVRNLVVKMAEACRHFRARDPGRAASQAPRWDASKLKTATRLGVQVISEDDGLALIGG